MSRIQATRRRSSDSEVVQESPRESLFIDHYFVRERGMSVAVASLNDLKIQLSCCFLGSKHVPGHPTTASKVAAPKGKWKDLVLGLRST